tara:strand:+ start:479 stop:1099 length:621 start_codon:yes stop_codon:yes gene_type:complete
LAKLILQKLKQMKILNLYAGIGGNRKLWGNDHKITAIEIDQQTADIYKKEFLNDTVIVGDAHQYLLDHYKEFDFIWSSPPCPTHSVTNHFLNAQGIIRYPDMMLWQEIIFLKHFCKVKYCVENVKSYYDPMFNPKEIGRHYLWSNFTISTIEQPKKDIGRMNGNRQAASKKNKQERNMVNYRLGQHVLDCAMNVIRSEDIKQGELF